MARRSDHSRDELKEMILKASWDIVEKDGFIGLTARRIAKDIGYAPGTIYNIFKSMDDLCVEINGMTLDKLHDVLSKSDCYSPKKSPVQNMKRMAQLYREFAREYRAHWLMLFTHALPEGQKAPAWYQEKIARLFESLEGLLEPFYTARQLPKRKMAARALWAAVHGICLLEETGKIPAIDDQESPPDMTGYLIENFIAGIKKKT
ncbi:MAG: TetR family transcriptional regulator [Micavibrio sp.]|nr:MAG: TetR family transcriptional regulator [Micavibrio sp.]